MCSSDLLIGPSGAGKSTLLRCLNGLVTPTAGDVRIGDEAVTGASPETLRRVRARVGFVFQQFNLLPTLTVMQNVVLPLKLAGRKVDRALARDVLERVGLAERIGHLPVELSGGQQQRVAIARALVTRPRVLFADEPTGALDTRSARDVLGLLQESVHMSGQTVVMVTHDPVAASFANAVLYLADGRIVGHQSAPTAEAVAERMTHLADEVERQRTMAEDE